MSAAVDSYQLGIDLGTTYTAAAVARGDQVKVIGLGNHGAAIPSVIHVGAEGTVLVGDAAERRGPGEPDRIAREFKRRIGDTTPLLLGGAPYSAEMLSAHLLYTVITKVAELEGGPPSHITVTHPANWGPYKQNLLAEAIDMVGATASVLTEPEAAAISYASNERVEPGSTVAVYDLGGGTFDAAVLTKTRDGFEILGRPEGIEHLGGIDFDEAVVDHVRAALNGALDRIDVGDPATMAALVRLRRECIEAKEALSADTETVVPVVLPGVQTEVRLTRGEFEQMVEPTLAATVDTMGRALGTAGVDPDEITAVLLVGGSSRIPLVAQLVSDAFGRPVAVDAHPKHAVALGAARHAALAAGAATAPVDATDGMAPVAAAGGLPEVHDGYTSQLPAADGHPVPDVHDGYTSQLPAANALPPANAGPGTAAGPGAAGADQVAAAGAAGGMPLLSEAIARSSGRGPAGARGDGGPPSGTQAAAGAAAAEELPPWLDGGTGDGRGHRTRRMLWIAIAATMMLGLLIVVPGALANNRGESAAETVVADESEAPETPERFDAGLDPASEDPEDDHTEDTGKAEKDAGDADGGDAVTTGGGTTTTAADTTTKKTTTKKTTTKKDAKKDATKPTTKPTTKPEEPADPPDDPPDDPDDPADPPDDPPDDPPSEAPGGTTSTTP